jgi:hypothetical protein
MKTKTQQIQQTNERRNSARIIRRAFVETKSTHASFVTRPLTRS